MIRGAVGKLNYFEKRGEKLRIFSIYFEKNRTFLKALVSIQGLTWNVF